MNDPLDTVTIALATVLRDHFTLMVSERQSLLGSDAHREAVLRRVACGEPGAVILDGKYLLTSEAHNEEVAILLRHRPKPKTPSEPPTAAGGAHV